MLKKIEKWVLYISYWFDVPSKRQSINLCHVGVRVDAYKCTCVVSCRVVSCLLLPYSQLAGHLVVSAEGVTVLWSVLHTLTFFSPAAASRQIFSGITTFDHVLGYCCSDIERNGTNVRNAGVDTTNGQLLLRDSICKSRCSDIKVIISDM